MKHFSVTGKKKEEEKTDMIQYFLLFATNHMRLTSKNGKVIVIGYGRFKEIGKCNSLFTSGPLWFARL